MCFFPLSWVGLHDAALALDNTSEVALTHVSLGRGIGSLELRIWNLEPGVCNLELSSWELELRASHVQFENWDRTLGSWDLELVKLWGQWGVCIGDGG